MRTQHTSSRGFTLVEIAIVLVVIGLVVGGVLVGQDLMLSAKRRNLLSTLEKYNTAVNAFRTKYGCVPGDCPNGTSFFAYDIYNGDSDGVIFNHPGVNGNWPKGGGWLTMDYIFWSFGWEITPFWDMLSQSGLIKENFAGAAYKCLNDVYVGPLAIA